MTDYANNDTTLERDRLIMQAISDSSSTRKTVVQALVFQLECLDELMQMGCANAGTQRQMNAINAALLWIETQQLELPF